MNTQLELRDIDQLIPYDNNPKRHPDEQITALSKSIKAHGWTQPIVVDESGVILIGHGRRQAALQLGLKQVPVLVRDDLTEAQKRAVRIGDNTLSAMGEIDLDKLNHELSALMNDADYILNLDDLGLSDFTMTLEDADEESLLGMLDDGSQNQRQSPGNQPEPGQRPEPRDYSKPDLSQEKQPVSLFQCVITCDSEAQQQEVYNFVKGAGYEVRVLTI
jgi:hypothetical protein